MTRKELLDSIKHLKWTRSPQLRCERGDCPILAALRVKDPAHTIFKSYAIHCNHSYGAAARWLGLDRDVANEIVKNADTDKGSIPELEGTRQ